MGAGEGEPGGVLRREPDLSFMDGPGRSRGWFNTHALLVLSDFLVLTPIGLFAGGGQAEPAGSAPGPAAGLVPRAVGLAAEGANGAALLKWRMSSRNLWGCLRLGRKHWLAPIIVTQLFLGLLFFPVESWAVAPFIHALF